MIVAYSTNRVIGNENSIPWQGKLPADMKHFKDLSVGKTVVMGRRTFESIGRPLPFRQNIVLSRQDVKLDGATVVNSLAQAYEIANGEICIIGGAEIYKMGLVDADIIYATEIHASVAGTVHFPKLSDEWHEVSREAHLADEKNAYNYSFVTYAKQR
ncbi:Dihydrofolate reductase type 3 [compost metagenome]